MSHEITHTNGKAEMAYVGATPWHGLGQRLEGGASIETWQEAAGMAWLIKQADLTYEYDGKTLKFPDKTILHRSDTGAPLGVVSNRYKVVQPAQVLDFFAEFAESGKMSLETAGTLFGGRRFWALAKTNETLTLPGEDVVNGYFLLATSADGTLQTQARFTSVRVVCNNTLSLASRGSADVKVRHSTEFDAAYVKMQLKQAHASWADFKLTATRLSHSKLTRADASEMTAKLLRLSSPEETKRSAAFKQIMDNLDRGIGMDLPATAGTRWGWVNAVTQYVDHDARGKTDSHRMSSAWFGVGDALKSKALELAA